MVDAQRVKYAIENQQEYETELTDYCKKLFLRSNKQKITEFANFRKFQESTVNNCSIFYVGEMAEMILPEYFDRLELLGVISETNKKPIFRDRWVIPIKNTDGLIQNLVGYAPNADERYIYGTSKYYRRRDTLYGLENLQIAYDLGYAFITEGITDTIRLRDMGYLNTFAMCGTHSSEYIKRLLNRCRHGVILIPDRDDAGIRALKGWDLNRSITIFINFMYKDVDEMCKQSVENQNWFKECADNCIDWVKSDTHKGIYGIHEKVTIM